MSGFAFAVLLSAFSTGQIEPGYWQQPHQFSPFEWQATPQRYYPYGGSYGQWQGEGFDSWDWSRDPFAGTKVQVFPRMTKPRPVPIRNVPGKHYGPGDAVRQSLSSLSPDSPTMQSYRKAIDAMKKLPPEDPHSLVFQANIHGYPGTSTPDPLWGQCQHGNWWFFPWHRAYLHCFEKIVRRYSEDPTFALPYWDYSVESSRSLPVAFRDPASPLYDGSRGPAVNAGTDQLSSAIVVDGYNASMANTVFADFGPVTTFGGQALNAPVHRAAPHGALESVPHDLVHGFVGGNLASVEMAARDPIFFCHHANIDRIWVVWLQMGQGRANPANEAWLNQQFTFYDENKQKINISVRQVVDTSALGYTYDRVGPTTPTPPSTPAPRTPVETVATLKTADVALQNRPVTLTMEIPERVREKFRKRPGTGPVASAVPNQIQLKLEEARFRGAPDSTVAVYLNLPPNSPIPGPRSQNFAGYFTFFGDHHNEGYSSQLDVTRHLMRIWQNGAQQRAEFTVTLVRVSPGTMPRDFRAPITFKELSLSATK